MRVATDNPGSTTLADSSVVAIGNFDGVHRGHQELVRRCHDSAADGDTVTVLTFEPLPQAWFRPDSAPARLTPRSTRLRLFESFGVELVWMVRFDQHIADMEPRAFVQAALAETLGARQVVVGHDFRFGRRRQGDVEMLAELGAEFGFEVIVVPAVMHGDERVSSSRVRAALDAGNFGLAEELLGRPFRMEGTVVRGRELGRKLGYPTANIALESQPCPLAGVFAVRARTGNGRWRDGVVNLGHRPAVGGGEFLLEVHLFDFERDLYGMEIEVEFIEKLREERDFDTMDDLVGQMHRDAARARAILGQDTILE